VVDYFATTLLDVARELALPAYVYFTSAASMLALMLRLPALDEEVTGDLEAVEGADDAAGLPPVPAGLMPAPLMKKDPNYASFVRNKPSTCVCVAGTCVRDARVRGRRV